jgi:MFS family permease
MIKARGVNLYTNTTSLSSPQAVDSSINHAKKIAAMVGSMFLCLMAIVGVALVVSGIFAPFGISILGAVYLAGLIGLGSATITGLITYAVAKFFPSPFNEKKRQNTIESTAIMIGIIIGASLGGILTAMGCFMAAPAILPSLAIALAFAWVGCITCSRIGKFISTCTKPVIADAHKCLEKDVFTEYHSMFRPICPIFPPDFKTTDCDDEDNLVGVNSNEGVFSGSGQSQAPNMPVTENSDERFSL